MKFLVFVGIVVILCKIEARPSGSYEPISKDMPDVLLETMNQAIICSREIGDGTEKLQSVQAEGILPEDNEQFNAYFGCIWKKKGIVTDNSEIDENNLRRYLTDLFTMGEELTAENSVLVNDVIGQCEDVRGIDYGQTAVKVNNCALNYLYKLVADLD